MNYDLPSLGGFLGQRTTDPEDWQNQSNDLRAQAQGTPSAPFRFDLNTTDAVFGILSALGGNKALQAYIQGRMQGTQMRQQEEQNQRDAKVRQMLVQAEDRERVAQTLQTRKDSETKRKDTQRQQLAQLLGAPIKSETDLTGVMAAIQALGMAPPQGFEENARKSIVSDRQSLLEDDRIRAETQAKANQLKAGTLTEKAWLDAMTKVGPENRPTFANLLRQNFPEKYGQLGDEQIAALAKPTPKDQQATASANLSKTRAADLSATREARIKNLLAGADLKGAQKTYSEAKTAYTNIVASWYGKDAKSKIAARHAQADAAIGRLNIAREKWEKERNQPNGLTPAQTNSLTGRIDSLTKDVEKLESTARYQDYVASTIAESEGIKSDDETIRIKAQAALDAAKAQGLYARDLAKRYRGMIGEMTQRLQGPPQRLDSSGKPLGENVQGPGLPKDRVGKVKALTQIGQAVKREIPGVTRVEQGSGKPRNIQGTTTPSNHNWGGAIDVFAKGATELAKVAAWAISQPGIKTVIYNRQIWSRTKGWRPYNPKGHPHDDHVHIDMGK